MKCYCHCLAYNHNRTPLKQHLVTYRTTTANPHLLHLETNTSAVSNTAQNAALFSRNSSEIQNNRDGICMNTKQTDRHTDRPPQLNIYLKSVEGSVVGTFELCYWRNGLPTVCVHIHSNMTTFVF